VTLCLGQTVGSCAGKCDQSGTIPGAACQCNKPCVDFGDCCPDYQDECGGTQGTKKYNPKANECNLIPYN
jgi:hypothetical protein